MLPSSLRLNLRPQRDFFSRAQSIGQRHILALYDRQGVSQGLKVAVIVPKRHGKAVQRVKTKRLLRAATVALRRQLPDVFALPYDLVFLVRGRPQTYEVYLQEMQHILQQLAQKTHSSPAPSHE